MHEINNRPEPIVLPLLAMRGLVLFPKMVLHFEVGREKSIKALQDVMEKDRRIFLVTQKDVRVEDPDERALFHVGVVAEVKQIVKSGSGNNLRVLVEGLYRAKLRHLVDTEPYYTAETLEFPLREARPSELNTCDALMRTVKDLFEEYCSLSPKMPKDMVINALISEDPHYVAEYIAANIPLRIEEKQEILIATSPVKRLELLASYLESENDILSLEKDIYDRVKESIDKNQREYYLREQMRVIQEELGESDNPVDEAQQYFEKIDQLALPDEAREKLYKEADRLMKLPSNSHEGGVIRGYLDTCLELPWNKSTKDKIDLQKAEKLLDKEHYGLQRVKERILEVLATRALAPDIKGQIICLVGPPGVGKTSIARSIAKAMGRKYVRISLGGVRDESDIRGHRKTYIGAMPGRIINAIKLAGSNNPLMLLDEVDKMGNDFRGDPSSAMLEVLDSEQNFAFRDHYIEIPFDLSEVFFIATANDLSTIPAPLLDRMDVIELPSYTREEKFQIAKRHLLAKQMKKHGLTAKTFRLADDAIYGLIDFYTRESGVRKLEREIGALCRKADREIVGKGASRVVITGASLYDYLGPKRFRPDEPAERDEIGLVNGLAWTSVGGEMLQVEVAVMEGSGKVELTGSLGDVMKESAKAAISYIRSRAQEYGIDPNFYKNKDIHIHLPEGAVPKDGPSAGVTLTTALVSALTGTPVRRDVAMTGEITLRGRVLAIGGLREKTMAAYRAGIKTVLIPKENLPDLYEVDPVVKEAIRFIPADHVETVLQTALCPREEGKEIHAVLKKAPAKPEAVLAQ
ncbi:endopeptidase La [Phocea massiliensis]|uniref:endopeptidase La n=1 Tax=Merdimmobilis hominis TaxID=2897707 RepID=UPI001E30ECD9|nr:endopeptidase La [Merdimmobilis hominis]MCD4836234.1 endopeptidase La [Merdimmobilis hominis]